MKRFILSVALLGSCADHHRGVDHVASQKLHGAPLGAARVLSVKGTLEVETAGAWRPARVGDTVTDVTRVRTTGGAAMLELGAKSSQTGRLWLRPGTTVALAAAGDRVLADVAQGAARLSLFAGDDLLLAPGAAPVRVAERPERADWTVTLTDDAPAHPMGIGWLETRTAGGALARLDLRSVDVKAEVAGDVVETTVDEVFVNPTDARMEGTFRFPLPDGAELTGLAMEIDGHLVEGSLVERRRAQEVYDEVVDKMLDPGILEWEQGNVFKLRVFPIEARADKKIVIRYLAPLRRAETGWQVVYPTAAPDLQRAIPSFRVTVDGKVVTDAQGFQPGAEIIVPVPEAKAPARVMTETLSDGTYYLARFTPAFAEVAHARAQGVPPRRVVVIVDTSRSALEARKLAGEALRALLGELRPVDAFKLEACDIVCRAAGDFAAASPDRAAAALAFVDRIEPDGASDLALALRTAGRDLGATGGEVVYVGDGVATWGETASDALRGVARDALGGAPLHGLVVGKGAGGGVMADLTGASGGKLARPLSLLDARRFALALAFAGERPRLRDATLSAPAGVSVYPSRPTTVFAGDELAVALRVPKGTAPPAELTLAGDLDGKRVEQRIALAAATSAPHVAKRWARQEIDALESGGDAGAHKDELVKLSQEHGILSHQTAFLVLESEEMWERFKLERREKLEAEKRARVTGGDLESVAGDDARLSPDHIQPGDPEIRVPAPADARSVEILFPFGETKLAAWEAGLRAWTVRFLVDKDTPDGTYYVTVKITLADGTIQMLRLPYVVDTRAPEMTVTAKPAEGRPGVIEIDAVQASGDDDARLVEVRVPSGDVIQLKMVAPGQFRGFWRAGRGFAGPLTLAVVVGDRAQNTGAQTVTLDVR